MILQSSSSFRRSKNMKNKDEEIALIVNSHQSSEDIWPAFIGEYHFFGWERVFSHVYILTSAPPKVLPPLSGSDIQIIEYDPNLPYNLQYLSCIKRIRQNVVAIANEDCIPCGPPNEQECLRCIAILMDEKNRLSFIKLVRGEETIYKTPYESLYEIDPASHMYFTQQVSFWKKKDLLDVYAMSPTSYIGRKGGLQQEEVGSEICRAQRLKGYLYYNGESKRGLYHYDTTILPHICTAIIGGRWNTHEYNQEVRAIAERYRINLQLRGFYEGN